MALQHPPTPVSQLGVDPGLPASPDLVAAYLLELACQQAVANRYCK